MQSIIPLDFPDSDEIIFQSKNLVAIYCRASNIQSTQLIVAFHALQLTHYLALPRKGQSRETLRAAGLDSVQIIPRGNQWYQYEDVDAMIGMVRLIADTYCEVIAYGQSMGAYGAIHTSALLRPNKVLAICPQFSIDPKKISFDSGFNILANEIDFIRDDIVENASPDTEYVIAYDQFLLSDKNHYLEYEKYLSNLYRLRMPFCGHGVSEALKKADMIPGDLIQLILQGKNSIDSIRQKFRKRRSHVPAYRDAMRLYLANRYLKSKNFNKASFHAFKLYTSTRLFSSLQLFCEMAEKLSTPQQAAARWFFAVSNFDKKIPSLAYVRAVKYSRICGDLDVARTTCLSALHKFPGDFGLMREYLDILIIESKLNEIKKVLKDLKLLHSPKANDVIRNRKAMLTKLGVLQKF